MSDLKLLTQGAEGRVFSCQWLGKSAVIKHRFKKNYRHPDLDALITKERIKAEAKTLVRCRMIGLNVPTLYDVNLQANEIIMENLLDTIQVRKYIYDNDVDSSVILSLAIEIGHILAKLHENDIIHGDLTTSNILIKITSSEPVIYLIDFGLSYVSEQAEDKAVDLYVLERAILSTHPNSDNILKNIWDAYRIKGKKKAVEVLTRLDDVRTRGRKKLCFG